MAYEQCFARVRQAAGRELTAAELDRVFERVHQAALAIKAGRASKVRSAGLGEQVDTLIQQVAHEAAAQLQHEAAVKAKQAHLQILRLSGVANTWSTLVASGVSPLKAVEMLVRRDFSGRANVESLEQHAAGVRADLMRKLGPTWDALGDDWLGFFQSREKLVKLVRELRGEDSADAMAKRGMKAFADAAEEGRVLFNAAGGDIGRLDDWGMPQHHSQEKVSAAGREAWVNKMMTLVDRARYVDDAGARWNDARMRSFLEKAWSTIATDGHANREPGVRGAGKRANQHAEHRQIHYKDAESVIAYWEEFGDKTVPDILIGHIETMARDIAFIEKFGPNPDLTFQTVRDQALAKASEADPTQTKSLTGQAVKLDILYDYAAGRSKLTANKTFSWAADVIANLNVAGKLGGSALASLFGDKPMMEAVSHLNNLPALQRWRNELALLNPANAEDRRLLERQGLMLDGIRAGLHRFYEGLGATGLSGKLAGAVMRVTGMQAINEIRKGAFGVSLMGAIGHEIRRGVEFGDLVASDIRTLKHFGITEADWKVWKLASLDNLGGGNDAVLTPEAISHITEEQLRTANVIGAADGADAAARVKRDAIVKLLGAVNTESEFAIVTPGWKERAQFYGALQRGTVLGEVSRSWLQFKSFPWAFFQRGIDAVINKEGGGSRSTMAAYLVVSTTAAGAMLLQTREMLAGKDPREMKDKRFWAAAFVQGGALGIYGDFFYSANHTRYGTGPLEAMAGPTIGPLLELGITQPLGAIAKRMEGKETHLAAQTAQDLKGWVPGGNVWYAKAALDHLVFQQIFEALSPGYMNTVRSRTVKEFGQDWWWSPGSLTPERAPDLGAASR